MHHPVNFRGEFTGDQRVQVERAGSPVPSCVSLKSDRSMHLPVNFKGEFTGDQRVQVERAGSPVPSCVSLKSDRSMHLPVNFKGEFTGDQRVQVERAGSPVPSCVSLKSDRSMHLPVNFKGEFTGDQRIQHSLQSSSLEVTSSEKLSSPKQSLLQTLMKLKKDEKLEVFQSHLSQDCPECFKTLSEDPSVLDKFMKMKELFMGHQIHDYPECTEGKQEDPEALYTVEKMLETCGSERSLKITLHILRDMKQKDLADSLERDESIKRAQQVLKTQLKKKFECIFEGLAKQGHPTLLNEIYTELYITEGGSGGVNNEHEVRQIETASKGQTTQETAIICNDIFKPLPGQEKPMRTVLTKGIAGIGKTVSVQKFILDWAEGKANQDIDFIFTLPFRDLNCNKERTFSLMQLLQNYFPQLQGKSVEGDEVKVVFIFDGLDECRLPLHFQGNETCCDITETSSVDVLLTSLIKGNLLPSALLWITSRPAAASQIPPECVHRVTEVRGFNDPQKEEYFRKRIRDRNLASRIILHIKSSRSLYIMCHIPVFCWISATVLETMLGKEESGDLPKTLTEMYTHFLLIQTNVKNQKYHDTNETNQKKMSDSDAEIILKLGQLAFLQLEKGNLIFYEEDLRESGIDVSEASEYSGVCTEIFKEECGLYQEKVYCFVHLSIQEFLAALFVFHSCANENRNVLRPGKEVSQETLKKDGGGDDFDDEVDEEERSDDNDDYDDHEEEKSDGYDDFDIDYDENDDYDDEEDEEERSDDNDDYDDREEEKSDGYDDFDIDYDENDDYDDEEDEEERSDDNDDYDDHEEDKSDGYDDFDIDHDDNDDYDDHEEKEEVEKVEKVDGNRVQLSELHRSAVDQALESKTGHLDLFLRFLLGLSLDSTQTLLGGLLTGQTGHRSESNKNTIQYIKMKIEQEYSVERTINLFHCLNELNDNSLVEEIQNSLRSGKLSDNELEPHQCSALAFVLLMSEEILDEFDLRTYNTSATGLMRLVAVVRNCRKAILNSCDLTETSCDIVASALQSSNSPLRDLDLSYNNLGDSGVKLLCAGLMSPNCKLLRLGLTSCDLTEKSCDVVASALQLSNSTLRDLDLSYNNLGDSGVKLLCAGLMSPNCKLQILDLSSNNLGDRSVRRFCGGLMSPNCELHSLDLSYNNLGDAGVKLLCAGLMSPNCKLQRLGLNSCDLTEKCCDIVASALQSSNSPLRDLDLSYNNLGDSGVKLLYAGLRSPNCKLQRLGLNSCDLTEKSCDIVASALQSSDSPLRDLDLSYNNLGDSGVELLCAGLISPNCKLQVMG
ncbi:NACHT, LRR and PYD domains-containing protein 12-like [Anguilla anguilla]|uniref:NACHT, LRR and PYD domains-containing protein 12-like n=1 Tax=Anguilla anguilla TaxID=7936 RepID=UPI0015B0A07F|nr:NACHT, LRR and PYD domains-containing protein 12-like [Anguilla anguilla]